jgi:haloalkane dehalogenase
MAQASPAPAGATNRMVQAPGGRLHVTDHAGQDPPLLLLHGFPDDSRIYDGLAPLLAPHRAVALDWLGYGRSDRAEPGLLDGAGHQQQLRAVLDALQVDRVVLVGHDAGGPDAVDFALDQPDRLERLILLNAGCGRSGRATAPGRAS